jgi:DNA-binding beta-propeller fold protein YncE
MSDARVPKGAGKAMELGEKSMKVWLRWPAFALVISLAIAGCGSNNSTTVSITISPGSATVLLNTSLQFIPNVTGSSNAIQWSVNGIANGNATVGTIDSVGLYTAPATIPASPTGVAVPVVFCTANSSLPNAGSSGAVCELQVAGSNLTNFSAGNTITIANSSQAGWDGSFLIEFAESLSDGNFGVQIPNPAGPPSPGTGGTAKAVPNLTISAQVSSTNAVATATVSLDSGVRVALSQTNFTIGTNEQFPFAPLVSVRGTSNTVVIWTVSTGIGTIDPTSGLYIAPATTGTATITATSVVDPVQSASATVTIVTAADPTITSLNPPTGALGAAFQEVYLSGSNFISTTLVFVNGTSVPSNDLFSLTSGTLLVVVPDSILSTLPTALGSGTPLTFTVARQGGAQQVCSPSPCTLTLSPVRPAIVAVKPDSIQQSASSPVTLDGGYFGTNSTTSGFTGTAVVNVQFNGTQIPSFNFSSDRELQFNVTAGSPGLYPITVTNIASCQTIGSSTCGTGSPNGAITAVNLAVQPPAPAGAPPVASVPVGTTPTAVGINTATGIAVVTNQGSNDVTLIDLATNTAVTASLCTGTLGSVSGPGCVASAPVAVAVDNVRNLALVANAASATLAVINLNSPPQVTALLTFPSANLTVGAPSPLIPRAVGINPVSGRALVALTSSTVSGSNAGAILDLTQSPPAVIGAVNLNNGLNPHIAVSPKLNWAIATPGGAGSLSIVDLGRSSVNQISSITCTPGTSGAPTVVAANTTSTLALQVGQPVLISGVIPSTFNGIFSVTSVSNSSFQYRAQAPCPSSATSGSGGTVSYALPVATVATNLNVRGVSIDDETQKALLVDPTNTVPVFVFNILDQSSTAIPSAQLPSATNNVAAAMDPLMNIGLVVNQGVGPGTSGEVSIIDPVTPHVLFSFPTGTSLVIDASIDPATSKAVIVSQGDNSLKVFSLGALRTAPQIVQASFAPVGSGQSSSHVTINSSLGSPAAAQDQAVTLIGSFTTSSVPRLDGNSSLITPAGFSPGGCGTAPNICRALKATISATTLAPPPPQPATNGGPRVYAVDAEDPSAGPSNAEPLQVIQAVSLVTSDCSNPAPQGVAIDATHNVAVVTEPGCNPSGAGDVSMVNLATGSGFGGTPELAVGNNPQGVAVYPQAGLAVVANSGSNTVSVVDLLNDGIATAFTVDPIPSGVAVNQGTGNAVVTASGASLADTFPVSTSAQTPATIGVLQGPTGVAIDPKKNVAVVADSNSSRASVVGLSTNTTTLNSGTIVFPQGVVFDPIANNFLITSSATNQVTILNPNSGFSSAIRVGIDPSSIAYNFESGTLVTANNLSGTMTVVDFIDQTVRGVFSLRSSTQFAVDIHPQTNLAVVADTVGNQLLLVPLPH